MLISVVIPLYNKKNTVKRALESVWSQILEPLEIIVVNDGCTDGSEKVVEEFAHPLVRLMHQENAGVSAARNKGIAEAKGDWIAFLDADDYWDERFLKTMFTLHADFPKANVLASNYRYQNFRGDFSKTRLKNLPFGTNNVGILDNYFEVASTSSPPLWSSAIVVKKAALRNIGIFPIGVTSGEDLITWAKLAISTTIAYTIEPLSTFVLDPAHSYDEKPNRIPESFDYVGQQLNMLLRANPSTVGLRRFVAHWYKMRASIYLRLGKKSLAFMSSVRTLMLNPLQPKIYIYLCLLALPKKHTLFAFRKLASAHDKKNCSST
jgi:glycosyltransferase involved in cell wall biosynthesis